MNTKGFRQTTRMLATAFYNTAREELRELSTEEFRIFMRQDIDDFIVSIDLSASNLSRRIDWEESPPENWLPLVKNSSSSQEPRRSPTMNKKYA